MARLTPPSRVGSVIALLFSLIAVETLPTRSVAQQSPETEKPLAPAGKYITTWVGNSFAAGDAHVPLSITGLLVTEDGSTFTNSEYDESGGEVTEFDAAGRWKTLAGHTHGWGYNGGASIAANSKYFFIAQQIDSENGGLVNADTWPKKGFHWFGVSRRPRSDVHQGASFTGGKGTAGDTLSRSLLFIAEEKIPPPATTIEFNLTQQIPHGISALAASESKLFVADPLQSRISIFDTTTMLPVDHWENYPRVSALVLDRTGLLWIAQAASEDADQRTSGPRITAVDSSGKKVQQITLSPGVFPVGLAVDRANRIFVADGGAAATILIFDPASLTGEPTKAISTFGKSMFDGTGPAVGQIAPARFADITGVGVDADDELFVSTSRNGASLQKYDRGGHLQWARYGLTFVDNSSIDPLNGDIFSSEEHYRFDWSLTAPGTEWSYVGRTFDRDRYPQDFRQLHECSPLMRRLNGNQLYAFCSDQGASGIYVYRFDISHSGEVAIPSTCITKGGLPVSNAPANKAIIWRDANGNGRFDADEFQQPVLDSNPLFDSCWGWWVDEVGDIWQTVNGDGPERGIRHYRLDGFDEHANPIYRFSDMKAVPIPAPFLNKQNDGLERAVYSQPDDVMYLAGYTSDAQSENLWGSFRVIARYDHWLQGDRTPRWVLKLPWNLRPDASTIGAPIGFAIAGDYLFQVGLSTASKVRIYRLADGTHVGDFVPNNNIFTVKDTGWVDIRPFGVQASHRPDGTYAVLVEDDFHGKTVVYRWFPGG